MKKKPPEVSVQFQRALKPASARQAYEGLRRMRDKMKLS
jgi:hypothetical protein